MSLVQEQDFLSRKACYLNPTFGSTHSNADLIIDDKLTEIKTIESLVLDRRHLHQLVHYYLVLSVEGIDVGRKRHLNSISRAGGENLALFLSQPKRQPANRSLQYNA